MEESERLAFQIEKARLIATAAHHGQFRRDGVTPYITHPEFVASQVEDRLKPIAWLHDVVEDTWINMDVLWNSGIEVYVLDAVYWLTRHRYETYNDYISRLINHGKQDAIIVKLADMRHNLSCQPSERTIEKAKWALPMLEEALRKTSS
jgi:(p)ppGpp synthase/HD superfamily hydrolase